MFSAVLHHPLSEPMQQLCIPAFTNSHDVLDKQRGPILEHSLCARAGMRQGQHGGVLIELLIRIRWLHPVHVQAPTCPLFNASRRAWARQQCQSPIS